MMPVLRAFAVVGLAPALTACGFQAPRMQLSAPDRFSEGVEQNRIIAHIRCELREGVRHAVDFFRSSPSEHPGRNVDWLLDWGAQVTFELTVYEKSGLNPGITFVTPFVRPTQTFSFGIGAELAAEATRKETISFSYNFQELYREPRVEDCGIQGGTRLEGDLRLREFIFSKALVAAVPGTVQLNQNGFPFSAFNYEATFVLTLGAGLTPSWMLVRLSANTGRDFLTAARTSTQYLTLTLGAVTNQGDTGNPALLDNRALSIHQATIIGQSVARSLQTITPRQ